MYFLCFFTSCDSTPECMNETNGVVLTPKEREMDSQSQEILGIYQLEDSIGEKLHKWGNQWVRESELDSIIQSESQPILDSIFNTLND